MKKNLLEKPDYVFHCAPVIEDICLEFGVDRNDAETITCMYEVFRRVTGKDTIDWSVEAYDEGYKEGYNDAIGDAVAKLDGASWDIEKLKKN